MQKLPLGIQTFSKIRETDYVYVDKTGFALDLIKNGTYYFLARPRRFGKSLFISTLQALFEGRKELFQGLKAYNHWDWENPYPVIKLSFSGVARTVADMHQDIRNLFVENQERLGISCDANDIGGCFKELIRRTCEQYNQRVVVLVDEYDKLILDNLDQPARALEAREILKDLYTTLKDSDEFIEFALLTGVSKFAKVSIFSGLNNLTDISLQRQYASLCGYTQAELEGSFARHLVEADMEKVREWYNGYSFMGEKVYNPFDILLFFDNNCIFSNYWFSTGTPTFLIHLIKKQKYFIPQLENLRISNALVDSFDIEDIRLEPILFQAGYLTIKGVEQAGTLTHYLLGFPNLETRYSFNDVILDYLTGQRSEKAHFQAAVYAALQHGDIASFKKTLIALFAAIPYTHYVNNRISEYEGYFASVIYACLASLGLDIIAEDVTNKGRIDLTIRLNQNIYILEFKVDGKGSALEQIRTRKYQEKYLHEKRTVYLIGIDFNAQEKNISGFAWEQVENRLKYKDAL